MASKYFVVFCAQMLLVKTVFSQTCGCGLSNIGSSVGLNSNIINNVGANNLGLNNVGQNLYNYPSIAAQPVLAEASLASLLASCSRQLLDNLSYGGALTVSSGSAITPNGISVLAENLVADGAVSVTGNIPLLGAVTVGGTVPTAGQAEVVYNTKPGIGLSSGGCGGGLASSLGGSLVGLSGGVGNGLSTCGCL